MSYTKILYHEGNINNQYKKLGSMGDLWRLKMDLQEITYFQIN